MELNETLINSETIYDGRVLRLERDRVLLPSGKEAHREVAYLSGAVCLLALDEHEQALVVEQYRAPFRQVLLELPAGKIDPGETPEQTAVRELQEETGYRPCKLEPLGYIYPTPGCVHEVIYIFLATELMPGKLSPDEDEFIRVSFMPVGELADEIVAGKVPDAKTQVAVLRYLHHRGKL